MVAPEAPDGSSGELPLDCGLSVKAYYDASDLPRDLPERLGQPGRFPFTRGAYAGRPSEHPWIIRVYSGFGTARQSNARFRKLIEWGAEEIQVAVDLPTQVGYDSDHIMATGEVGRVGVAIDSLADMEELFDGIRLDKLRAVGMLGNSFGPIALSFFIALGEMQGLKPEDYVVDLQNDILKEYVARGTYIYPIEAGIRVTTDVVAYCAKHAPHWHPISVCVNHLNMAGAGSIKGTAFAFANARAYLDTLRAQGWRVEDVAPLFSMFLDERDDFFVAVGLFRAARRLWAEMLRTVYGVEDERAMALRTTAYGHGRETRLEPLNNIARIALGSLAYVLGGVDALYNGSWDEALSTPHEEAVRVAIRTQQILRHEFGFEQVTDPLGGSYYLEWLTEEIEKGIRDELARVLALGGAVAAITSGYLRRQLTEGSIRRQKWFEEGKRVSVAVNRYVSADAVESRLPAFEIDADVEEEQKEKLAALRSRRDNQRLQEALENVRRAACSGENLVPPILQAVRCYATIGEITEVLRSVFGTYDARERIS